MERFFKNFSTKNTWKFLIQESSDGYTTNVAREELEKENTLLAYALDNRPLSLDHGSPLSFILPHLYGWKGAKFLKALKFSNTDEPGFWEVRGYHNRGDAFAEERYG